MVLLPQFVQDFIQVSLLELSVTPKQKSKVNNCNSQCGEDMQ